MDVVKLPLQSHSLCALETLDSIKSRVESGEILAVGVAYITVDSIGGDVSSGPDQVRLWAALQHVTNEHYENGVCS